MAIDPIETNLPSIPEFKYSLGRCLQVHIETDKKQLNISIDCLNDRIIHTYSRKIYASTAYVLHEFSNNTQGNRTFELFMCLSNPHRQYWLVVNREPKFLDALTVSWTQLTFYEECACNFRLVYNILYTNPPARLKYPRKAAPYSWKTKSYLMVTGVVICLLIVLLLCVICSFF
ncbi:uncharacterized protein LOC126567098 [Anopheles maculipalpis]|uniref:uncharacterized protein LOC126567098 n=1 Tax=Anopheles maculipalpis TaxID=1496333 RepID=UPI002158CBC0|nr:uncharacterized protein LOC126567098 [Anopheles maculipalpis]